VTILSRSEEKLQKATIQIEKSRKRNSQAGIVLVLLFFSFVVFYRFLVNFEVCDVSDEDQVQRAVERATQSSGPVDVVVSNAGLAIPKLFDEVCENDIEPRAKRHVLPIAYCSGF
jgi:NAD(P)-dependent dehydrogenase (short-subunit alcohol dehydrogenase family)